MTNREIDILVSERVMDKSKSDIGWTIGGRWSPTGFRPFSTEMESAWEIVEYICNGTGINFVLDYQNGSVTFGIPQDQDDGPQWYEDIEYRSSATSFSLAICTAALKLKGIEL